MRAALDAGTGEHDPTMVAETLTTTDPLRPTMGPFTTMAEVATNAGAITGAQAVTWLAELAHAGATGSFLWAVTMFAVGGVRGRAEVPGGGPPPVSLQRRTR